MKKLGLFFAITVAHLAYSQCTIEGKSSIQPNVEETYTVTKATGQCTDCHLWVTIGGNAAIVSDTKKSAIQLKAGTSGRQIISATVLTSDGIAQCSKSIDIGSTASANVTNNNSSSNKENCDITTYNYTEVKTSDTTVNFYPNELNTNFHFQWKTTYFDGEVKNSTMPTPQFPFSKTKGIKSVNVKITSSKCMKEFTKSYEENYWRFF
ncbi:hypothetical protein [Bergeyella zoohelcum]|uniref:Uncharacterized protein n=1 Tax=Bergeyella zoohelcum TaxID=1015 RepID=A0A376BYQ8_9FLAO|nr:hypothetical protein [Bergeyella zoohelcum]EKB61294.1 hypothetical protein HMPREF9700_00789 [Bergeyella zoohelcum CCUG 30536]SSZ46614.1 Uncharacterised protein [Bergeyella zoohelcum]